MSLALALIPAPQPESNFNMFPNEALDTIGYLDPYELSVYMHLFRLTRGFQVFSKKISLDKLALRTSIGRTKLKEVIAALENKGLIKVDENRGRSNSYTVFFPREISNWNELHPPLKIVKQKPLAEKIETTPSHEPTTPSHEPTTPSHEPTTPSHEPTTPSHHTTTTINTELKNECLKQQQEPVVGVQSPISPINDNFSPILSADNLGPKNLDTPHPLAALSDSSLAAAYKLADAWTVLRVIFTLIISYLNSKTPIANPAGMLLWALKAPKKFIPVTDKEIIHALKSGIKNWAGWFEPEDFQYWNKEHLEFKAVLQWINSLPEPPTLSSLWAKWLELCPRAIQMGWTLTFVIAIPPNPLVKQREEYRRREGLPQQMHY